MRRISKIPSDQFKKIVAQSVNFADACEKLGLRGGSALVSFKKRCMQESVDCSHLGGKRHYGKVYQINKDELFQLVATSSNLTDICEKLNLLGCGSKPLIKERCASLGIDISHLKNRRPRHRNAPPLTKLQSDVIIGSLLGDGSLNKVYTKRGQSCFVEGHCVEQEEYLRWKHEVLKPYFVAEPYIRENPKIFIGEGGKIARKEETQPSWMMRSVLCPLFTDLEREWYERDADGQYIYNKIGHRIKCVPPSLTSLTLRAIAVWFCDDGCVDVSRKTIQFCTNSFSKEEVERLIGMLAQHGIAASMSKSSLNAPIIRIYSDSFLKFFELVTPYRPPCKCMDYKFDISDYKYEDGRVKCADLSTVMELVEQKLSQKEIAARLGINRMYLCSILKGKSKTKVDVVGNLNYRNTTGVAGVSKDRTRGGYAAQLQVNKNSIKLGRFGTLEEASRILERAKKMRDEGVVSPIEYKNMAKEKKREYVQHHLCKGEW